MARSAASWQRLYLRPEPQWQGSLRPGGMAGGGWRRRRGLDLGLARDRCSRGVVQLELTRLHGHQVNSAWIVGVGGGVTMTKAAKSTKRTRWIFSAEFKQEAVRRLVERRAQGMTVRHYARIIPACAGNA